MRFLRKRFKDPFTGKDDWRLLHAGPGGIIIDSKVARPAANPAQWYERNQWVREPERQLPWEYRVWFFRTPRMQVSAASVTTLPQILAFGGFNSGPSPNNGNGSSNSNRFGRSARPEQRSCWRFQFRQRKQRQRRFRRLSLVVECQRTQFRSATGSVRSCHASARRCYRSKRGNRRDGGDRCQFRVSPVFLTSRRTLHYPTTPTRMPASKMGPECRSG